MAPAPAQMILDVYCFNHERILKFAEKLSPAQIEYRVRPGTLTIAFYLWHLGRWADHLQAAVPGMTEELSRALPAGQQVWDSVKDTQAWSGFKGALGVADTGMEMDESLAAQLEFPPKEILLDYVRQVFAKAQAAVEMIDEDQFTAEERPQPMTEEGWSPGGTVGSAVFEHLVHDHRHLGMMECLLGLQAGSGSATV